MRFFIFALFLSFVSESHAESSIWEDACEPFTDRCLFLIVSNETEAAAGSSSDNGATYKLAYHSGRLEYRSIPGGDLDFAPQQHQDLASEYLKLGRAVAAGNVALNLDKPISGFDSVLVTPYVLPEMLNDLSRTDVQAILSASDLPYSLQGLVIGRMLTMELNRGEYRFVNGEVQHYIDYLRDSPQSFLALVSMVIALAEEGYTKEAKEIVKQYLVPKNNLRAQDVLLYIDAIAEVFYGGNLRAMSLALAIQSPVFRLEALGQLYAMTRDPYIGKQYLSDLYDAESPISSPERRNIVLFTISTLE